MRVTAVGLLVGALAACQQTFGEAPQPGPDGSIIADDFESGTLRGWDGVDTSRHHIVSDPTSARSGSRYLAVTYPQGRDGGWLTRFFMPGYDSLYISYYVRFPEAWRAGTKLVAVYGSRIDDQWSGLGKAGLCPRGDDFFAAMLTTVAETGGDPGPVRFYTYYPGMAREPDGVTCWGRFGNGAGSEHGVAPAQYTSAPGLSRGAWHHVELFVELNTPGKADGRQTFWVDGEEGARWSGISFRTTDALRLNAVQLTFSAAGAPHTQKLDVDNLVVRRTRP